MTAFDMQAYQRDWYQRQTPEKKAQRAADSKARRAHRYISSGNDGRAVIVSDPDPLGGFPAGASIGCVTETLKMGHLTPGTVLIYGGLRMMVCGSGPGQCLEEFGRGEYSPLEKG